MVDVNDTHRTEHKLERRRQQVEDADIPEADRETILAFYRYRKGQGMETTTLTTDLSTLRNASERAEVALTAMGATDVDDFLELLTRPKSEGGYGLAPDKGGMYNYTRVLRVFFQWLDGREDRPDYPFWEDIQTSTQDVERPDQEDLLMPEDVQALKQAALNPRDRAFIAFLADGHRVTMATQLRVGDIHPEGKDPYFTPNGKAEGGHKGLDSSQRTLLWSKGDVAAYLNNHHPQPENPEAPLWPVLRDYDPENPQECALSPDRVRDMLKECARRADVEKRVNPHSFRHAAMTRLSNDEGLTPQQIQHLAGWADERMLEVYDQTSDRKRNDSIRAELGFETAESEEYSISFEPMPCPNCRREITDPAAEFCQGCGEPLDMGTRLARDTAQEDVREGMEDGAEDPDLTRARVAIQDALDDPDSLRAIADALGGQGE